MIAKRLLRPLFAASTALALAVLPLAAIAEEMSPAMARLQADVSFLADDEQEGRAPGTEGIERAAEYIAEAFRDAGLTTAEGLDDDFQSFRIEGSTRLGRPQQLTFQMAEEEKLGALFRSNFMPLSIGGGAEFEGLPVVFAGYGITARDEESGLDYDDYEGIDVEGKAVLILRRAPGSNDEGSIFAVQGGQPSSYATFQHKATNAFRQGARAVLLVNDLAGLQGEEDELLLFTAAGLERYTTNPFVMLSRSFADKLLESAGSPSLQELEESINGEDGPVPQSRHLEGLTVDGTISIDRERITTRNVVGVLEGSGPKADETIVIGGHYDHLGKGGRGSLAPFSTDIHNGADDNASGTAMVMELARRLAARPDPLPRRVVFIAFSGEERGLLGSRHYISEPLYPLENTVTMLNFDMVGRLNDEKQLTVFGVESTPGLKALVEALGTTHGFNVRPNAQVAGNSDHAPFYEKGIPVVFLFTGTHRDYHRPSDTADKVNFEGMTRIADFAEMLALDFVRRPDRPEFSKASVANREEPRRVSGVSVSLGTIPDYDESVKGVRLNGVREGSAAEKAGLKEGDVIIGFGDRPVGTIYDFMEGLSGFKPGDEVDVKVLRDQEEITLKAVLDASRPIGDDHGHGDND